MEGYGQSQSGWMWMDARMLTHARDERASERARREGGSERACEYPRCMRKGCPPASGLSAVVEVWDKILT